MRTMMLFMIAGYFLTHSKHSRNLHELFTLLNESLFLNGSEFSIDGFLVQKLSGSHWRMNCFGKNTQILCDGSNVDFANTAFALGKTRDGVYEYVDVKNKDEIILSINHVPGVRILKK